MAKSRYVVVASSQPNLPQEIRPANDPSDPDAKTLAEARKEIRNSAFDAKHTVTAVHKEARVRAVAIRKRASADP